MRLNTIILFCLIIATIHGASLARQPTKGSTKTSPFNYLRSVRGTKSCSSKSCPFWEKHGRSFLSLRCYGEQFQDCTCLHRMCFSSCLFSKDVCNAEMAQCIAQICPRCTPAAEIHLCSAQNLLVNQMTQSLNNFACYPCCAGTSGAASPLNSNTTTPPVNLLTPPVNNAAGSAAGSPINGGAGNTPRPVNGVGNAARPVNGAGNAARPVNGAGNAARPANGAGNAARPANGAGNAARPVNGAGNTARPVNGAGNAARPVNGAGNAARPVNGAGNAARPVNGAGNAARPVNGAGNAARPANGASLNQRVKKPKTTTRRTITKATKRSSATVRTTTNAQKKSKTTKRTKN